MGSAERIGEFLSHVCEGLRLLTGDGELSLKGVEFVIDAVPCCRVFIVDV